MNDDETRPVRAVRKRIAEQETKLRPAVVRRSTLLPQELLRASTITCIENMTWGSFFGVNTDSYHFEPGGLVAKAPWRLFFTGWRYEVRDEDGALRFVIERGLQWLIFQKLQVFDGEGRLLARFEDHSGLMAVQFNAVDDEGKLLLTFTQPANTYTRFFAKKHGVQVAEFEREYEKWKNAWRHKLSVRDAFNIVGIDDSLNEVERVLLLAASLFFDRLYFTGDNE